MAKSLIPKGYKWALCVSHDVDHLRHYWNLNLLKFWGVSLIEFIYGRITFDTFIECIRNSFATENDSWNQIELLASANKNYQTPATYFFVDSSGRGVDYGSLECFAAIKKLKAVGIFDIGVHGQTYDGLSYRTMADFELFFSTELGGIGEFLEKKPEGIRMHYLRWRPQFPDAMKKVGFVYDSTEFSDNLKQPYKMNNGLVEIPLHIMDTYLFSPFYKNLSLADAKDYALKMINRCRKEKKVLNILFHPRHLSTEFKRQREWYLWLLELAKNDKTCYKISLGEIAKKV